MSKLHRDTARIADHADTMLAALSFALDAEIESAEQRDLTAWAQTLQRTLNAIRPMRNAIRDVSDPPLMNVNAEFALSKQED